MTSIIGSNNGRQVNRFSALIPNGRSRAKAFAAMIILIGVSIAAATDIADWQLPSSSASNATATAYNSNLASAPVVAVSSNGSQGPYACSGIAVKTSGTAGNTLANAYSNTAYLTFTITPKAGYQATVNSVTVYVSDQGGTGQLWLESAASPGFNGTTALGTTGSFTACGSTPVTITLGTPISVSSAGVEFRLYAGNTVGSDGVGLSYQAATYSLQVGGSVGLATLTENDWTGATDNNWSTATNWSVGHVPVLSDSVVFSSANTANCNLDVAATAGSIKFLTTGGGYSGTFNFNSHSLTIGGSVVDFSGLTGTLTPGGTDTLYLTCTTAQMFTPGSGQTFPAITVNGSGGVTTISTNPLTCGAVSVAAGELKLGADLVATGITVSSGAALDLNGTTPSTPMPLTINGTGSSSGGALLNSSTTAASYSGLITLGSASSIQASNGNLSLTNAGTITGATFGLTLGGGAATTNSLASNIGTTSGSLTVSGGTWTLSGTNAYTGATSVSSGTLKLGSTTALGTSSGVTVSSGASLDLNGTSLVSSIPLTLNGTGIASGGALTNSSTSSASYGGLVALGSASSVIAANGNIALTNTGTISGATFGLTLGGGSGTSNSLASIIGTTSGSVTISGGTWALSGTNTYTGATTVNAGTLSVATIAAAYASAQPLGENQNITFGGGTLAYTGSTVSSTKALTLSGAGTLLCSTSGQTLTLSGNITNGANLLTVGGAGNTTLSGVLGNGAGGLTKQDAGTLTLSGTNTYTGLTTIGGGTVKLGNAAGLGTTANGTVVSSGAVLDLNGQSVGSEALTINGTGISSGGALTNSSASAASLSGLVTLGSSSSVVAGSGNIVLSNTGAITGSGFGLTLDGTNTASSMASGMASGTGTLTKNGSGTWTLTGTIAGSGLTVNAGTLTATSATLNVAGDVALAGGTLTAPTTTGKFTVAGNWTNNGGTFTPGTGDVTFNGTASGKGITTHGQAFTSLVINGAGGGWTLLDNLSASGLMLTQGTLDLGSGLTNTLSGSLSNAANTGILNFDNSTLNITGNVDLSSFATITPGTGTLGFTGTSGTQTFKANGSANPAIVHSGADILQLVTNSLSCVSLTNNAGTLDLNGNDITTSGNFAINNGTSTTIGATGTGLGGRTLTVGGTTTFFGTSASKLDLNPTSSWTINSTGALSANYATINNSDATGTAGIANAGTCTDGGSNTNWTFTVPPPKVWVGTTSSWNTASNWNPTGVPSAIDSVVFDNTALGDCQLDASGITINTIKFVSFSKNFNFNSKSLTVSGLADFSGLGGTLTPTGGTLIFNGTNAQEFTPNSQTFPAITQNGSGGTTVSATLSAASLALTSGTFALGSSGASTADSVGSISTGGGNLDFGTSTLKVGGNAAFASVGTVLNPSTGALVFNGGSAQIFTPKAGVTFPAIQQNGAGGTTVSSNALTCGAVTLTSGTLALGSAMTAGPLSFAGGTLTLDGGTTGLSHSVTTIAATSGTLNFSKSTLSATGNVNLSLIGTITNTSGTLAFTGTSAQTFTQQSGVTFPAAIVQNGSGGTTITTNPLIALSLALNSGTLSLVASGATTADSVGSISTAGGNIDWGTSTLEVGGNAAFGSIGTISNASTGTLTFNGASGNQTFTPKAGVLFPAIVHNTSDTLVQATNNLRCVSFTQSAGQYSPSSLKDTTTGNLTFTNGNASSFKQSGLTGCTFVVGGNANFTGTTAQIGMNATNTWNLNVTGTLNATYANIAYSTAGVTAGTADTTSTDGGHNTNWTFTTGPKRWVATTSGLWNAAANWSKGVVPASTDSVVFDATGTGDCSFNTSASVKAITFTSGYTGSFSSASSGNALTVTGSTADLRSGGTITGNKLNLVFNSTSAQTFYPTATGDTLQVINLKGTGVVTVSTNGFKADSIIFNSGCSINLGTGLTHALTSPVNPLIASTYTAENLNLGTSTLQVAGATVNLNNFTTSSGGTITGTGTLELNGSVAQTLTPEADSVPNLKISGSGGVTIATDLRNSSKSLTITNGAALTLTPANSADMIFSSITCSSAGGGGSIIYGNSNVSSLEATGNVDLSGLTAFNYTVNNGYPCVYFAGTSQNFTPPSAAVELPNLAIKSTATVSCLTNGFITRGFGVNTGTYQLLGTLNLGTGLTDSLAADGNGTSKILGSPAINFGSSTLKVAQTSLDLSGFATLTAGTGTLQFTAASGTQAFTPKSATVNPGILHTGAGTLQLVNNSLSTLAFVQSAGSFDFNAKDITNISDSLVVTNGTPTTFVNLGGRSITVAGNASLSGTSTSNLLDLNPSSAWNISVTGSLNAANAALKNSNAAAGSAGLAATGCTDGGANTHWTFALPDPALTAYAVNPAVYVVGSSITPNTVGSTGGAIDSFAVTPALPSGLSLSKTTGAITGTPTAVTAKAGYKVSAYNATATVSEFDTITVSPDAPSITYAHNPSTYVVGTAITPDTLTNTGGSVDSFTVAPTLPAGLAMSKTTGLITGTPTAVTAKAGYKVTAHNVTANVSVYDTITVNPAAVSFSYKHDPASFVVGLTWNDTLVNAGGPVDSFATTSAPPAWLSLNKTSGMISATPTLAAVGTDSITVIGFNVTHNDTVKVVYTVKIHRPTLTAYDLNPATYLVGSAITADTIGNTGGVIDSFTIAPALPSGLSLSKTTGAITGTPAAVASLQAYKVIAFNSSGKDSTTLTLTVNPVAPSVTYKVNPSVYIVNSPIAPDSVVNAGGAIDSFAVTPALPAGLTLDKTTGVISGTPTVITAKAAYAITAYNATGTSSVSDTLTVNPAAPSISYKHNPAVYLVNSAIVPDTLVNAGGTVDSFAVAPALPTGLSFSKTTGLITGTPSALTAKAGYKVTAYNVTGTASVYDTITVTTTSPSFTYKRNPASFIVGLTWRDTIVNAGGQVDKFTTSSAMPSGFTLDSTTGMVTGTPLLSEITSPAESVVDTLIVKGTNVAGSTTDTLLLVLKIKKPALTAYSVNPAVYVVGTPIASNTTSDTGGKVDSIKVTPALPAGLTLNDSTGAITGTPSAVAPKAAYTITAYNATGSMSVYDTITVNPAAPLIAYRATSSIYLVNSPIAPDSVLNAGGAIDSFTVTPALPAGLSLSKTTGVISGTPSATAVKAVYAVTAYNVTASASAYDTITVNPTAPSISYKHNPSVYVVATAIVPDTVVNAGGSVDSFTVAPALPSGLSLSRTTGVISGTPTTITAKAAYAVTAYNITGSSSIYDTITINPVAPSISYKHNPSVYVVGTAIVSDSVVNAGGAIDSFTVAPALPAGLSLSKTTGVISGTPTSVTTKAAYAVKAYNVTGNALISDTITVNPALPLIAYRSNPSVYIVNSPITPDSIMNAGGTIDSFVVSPALPTGLTLDKLTGVISGTPTIVTAKWPYAVTAYNVTGTASLYDTITVNPVAPSIAYKRNPVVYVVNSAIVPDTLVNSGGPVDSFTVTPALPAGLTVSKTTGFITGTPTTVTARAAYVVTAHNVTGNAAVSDTITVNPVAPSITYKRNPVVYVVNSAIVPDTLVNAGGSADSFTVAPALPAGLTVSKTTGLITGTPTVVTAKAAYAVTAYNVTGNASVYDTITVNPVAPSISYKHNPAVYVVNSAIVADTIVSAGGAIDSFNVTPALPAGLTVSKTTGLITGTPTVVTAKAAYTVTAYNVTGNAAVYDTITVNPVAPSITYKHTSGIYIAGSAIVPDTLVNVGGAIDSFTVTPALPAGLALSKTTGLITGTPTVITAKAAYAITAYNITGNASAYDTITVNPVAPSISYKHTAVVYVVNSAIVPDTLVNAGGPIDSFTVVPALPTGLTMNKTTGIISGTPTVAATKQAYLVTGYNATGSALVSDTITVNPLVPGPLTYKHNPVIYVLGAAVTPDTLANAGGAVDSFTVIPALPAGLTLDRTTGAISGTPVILTTLQAYKVTAWNATGTAVVYDTITVNVTTAVLPRSFMVKSFSLNGSSGLLRYALPQQSYVSLKYYDFRGRLVGSFVNTVQDAGYYSLLVPTSSWGRGSYIQVFKAGAFGKTERITILR